MRSKRPSGREWITYRNDIKDTHGDCSVARSYEMLVKKRSMRDLMPFFWGEPTEKRRGFGIKGPLEINPFI